MKKERLYKQLLSLEKHHRELVKTELQNIEKMEAEESLLLRGFSPPSHLTFPASAEDFNLTLTSFDWFTAGCVDGTLATGSNNG